MFIIPRSCFKFGLITLFQCIHVESIVVSGRSINKTSSTLINLCTNEKHQTSTFSFDAIKQKIFWCITVTQLSQVYVTQLCQMDIKLLVWLIWYYIYYLWRMCCYNILSNVQYQSCITAFVMILIFWIWKEKNGYDILTQQTQ